MGGSPHFSLLHDFCHGLLGHVSAVRGGRVGCRIGRRVGGRLTGRWLGRWFRQGVEVWSEFGRDHRAVCDAPGRA